MNNINAFQFLTLKAFICQSASSCKTMLFSLFTRIKYLCPKKVTHEVSIFSMACGHSINQAEVCFYSEYLRICKQFSILLLKKVKLPVNSAFILASQLVGVWLMETLPHALLFCFPFPYFRMQE